MSPPVTRLMWLPVSPKLGSPLSQGQHQCWHSPGTQTPPGMHIHTWVLAKQGIHPKNTHYRILYLSFWVIWFIPFLETMKF